MEEDLHILSERLKILGTKKPNAEHIKEVDEALQSKHEGIKVCAAKTLGEWGDKESIRKLKELLSSLSALEARWGAIGAVSTALAPHLAEEDINWAINLILRVSKSHNRFALHRLLVNLPKGEALKALEKEEIVGGVDRKEIRYIKNTINRGHA